MQKRKKPGEWYQNGSPRFEQPGSFRAWILGSLRPLFRGSPGVSAAVLEIVKINDSEPPLALGWPSDNPDSTVWRATVAAATGVLEALPDDSTVTIYSRLEPVVNALNHDLPRWANERFSNRPAEEIWRRVHETIQQKRLHVTAEHRSKPLDNEIFSRLKKRADELADAHLRKLGSQTSNDIPKPKSQHKGGFGAVEGGFVGNTSALRPEATPKKRRPA